MITKEQLQKLSPRDARLEFGNFQTHNVFYVSNTQIYCDFQTSMSILREILSLAVKKDIRNEISLKDDNESRIKLLDIYNSHVNAETVEERLYIISKNKQSYFNVFDITDRLDWQYRFKFHWADGTPLIWGHKTFGDKPINSLPPTEEFIDILDKNKSQEQYEKENKKDKDKSKKITIMFNSEKVV